MTRHNLMGKREKGIVDSLTESRLYRRRGLMGY